MIYICCTKYEGVHEKLSWLSETMSSLGRWLRSRSPRTLLRNINKRPCAWQSLNTRILILCNNFYKCGDRGPSCGIGSAKRSFDYERARPKSFPYEAVNRTARSVELEAHQATSGSGLRKGSRLWVSYVQSVTVWNRPKLKEEGDDPWTHNIAALHHRLVMTVLWVKKKTGKKLRWRHRRARL